MIKFGRFAGIAARAAIPVAENAETVRPSVLRNLRLLEFWVVMRISFLYEQYHPNA
jgi:hypothetical protein